MNTPPNKWYCDHCGETIDDPQKGYVIWKCDDRVHHSFKIIHQGRCDSKEFKMSLALKDFLGDKGRERLLSFLSLGPVILRGEEGTNIRVRSLDEFVDFFRRVQSPNYEEGRRYLNIPEIAEELSDSNELWPYLPTSMEDIVERGREINEL